MIEFKNLNGCPGSVFVRPEDVLLIKDMGGVAVESWDAPVKRCLVLLRRRFVDDEETIYGVEAEHIASRVLMAHQAHRERLGLGSRRAVVKGITIHGIHDPEIPGDALTAEDDRQAHVRAVPTHAATQYVGDYVEEGDPLLFDPPGHGLHQGGAYQGGAYQVGAYQVGAYQVFQNPRTGQVCLLKPIEVREIDAPAYRTVVCRRSSFCRISGEHLSPCEFKDEYMPKSDDLAAHEGAPFGGERPSVKIIHGFTEEGYPYPRADSGGVTLDWPRRCAGTADAVRLRRVRSPIGGHMARQGISIRNSVDGNGNPAGGSARGSGISIRWQDGPLGKHKAVGKHKAICESEGCDADSGGPARPGCTRIEPNGAFVEDVLHAAHARIAFYQTSSAGKFACVENESALMHIQEAMKHLDNRTKRRVSDGTEGTHEGS